MHHPRHSRLAASATLTVAALFALAACADPPVAPPGGPNFGVDGDHDHPPPGPPHVEVCKVGPAHLTFTFDITATGGNGGSLPLGPAFTLLNGECKTVWVATGEENSLVNVSITETTADVLVDKIEVLDASGFNTLTGTRTVSLGVGIGYGGAEITYFNSEAPPPPPPPPGGGEGCTPGYWKQAHHFDSWPRGLTPGMDFDTVFGVNLFSPNRSLLVALSTGGGGANRLGRHATAALLNATAGSGVSYDLSAAQVIALVQAAAASGDYDGASDRLEGFNEQSCPLN